jgi:hypothetical protein
MGKVKIGIVLLILGILLIIFTIFGTIFAGMSLPPVELFYLGIILVVLGIILIIYGKIKKKSK